MVPKQYQPNGFPRCVSLTIEFNPHAVYYQTVESHIAEQYHEHGLDFVSEYERQKAISSDSLWVCYWHPTTPVGSCTLAASSYEALMAHVNGGD